MAISGARSLTWSSSACTDRGQRRQTNQDSFLCDDELGLWIVADGMGGHAGGEVASREAVESVVNSVRRQRRELGAWPAPVEAARRVLEQAVQEATYMIFGLAAGDQRIRGMGTTVTALLRSVGQAIIGQVGDSRLYLLRDGRAEQLSDDHTLVNWQLKHGLISTEEAEKSRHRHVIPRAVGRKEYVQVDTAAIGVETGDRFLLCSDGLYSLVNAQEVQQRLSVEHDLDVALESLISMANQRGGHDNITALVVEVN